MLFVALWYRVYRITTLRDVTVAAVYLAGITIVYTLMMTLWIRHNLSIYRRKGLRRKGVVVMDFAAIHDSLGSYIVSPPGIKEKQAVMVTVNDGRKVFDESRTGLH
jgi:hypothetical protein